MGNANHSKTLDRIKQICPQFDIVIDDGAHASKDILDSFNLYFPLLKPGGMFVVEGTHLLYRWRCSHGGGFRRWNTATTFFKLFADVVNFEHWHSRLQINGLLGGFMAEAKLAEEITMGWVQSVEFRNSLIIRKELHPTHAKQGSRLILGTEAVVEPNVLKIRAEEKQPKQPNKSLGDPRTWF